MIESEYYKLPRKAEPKKPKPKEDEETLRYLERLPWRPFTCEW